MCSKSQSRQGDVVCCKMKQFCDAIKLHIRTRVQYFIPLGNGQVVIFKI